ncbi:MAG TPA: LLM class flavin-dependent oxidoreductase [Pseudonocardia sp.]|uniref:LLM class flavin-dependent oxidoreductase n=1 Tax=Pseudonocardia sp. TaxID=60912 RepID=UPI002B4B4356|nr:LLM class flavin-dependent oxidoreductase [Pseudonocardia sp.]HLU56286.1 LLM class flavin-dependent oxidoreductase [Pseudonocardia sp.]
MVLPQRNPVVLAEQAASLDVLSGGRLVLGVGAGYREPEMTAVGVPFAQRGRRTGEYIDAMVRLWGAERPRMDGRYVRFADVDAHPRPVRGAARSWWAAPARRRSAGRSPGPTAGPAWAPPTRWARTPPAELVAADVGRPARLGRLEITAMQLGSVDRATADRFAEPGVDRLPVCPLPLEDPDDIARFLEQHAALTR